MIGKQKESINSPFAFVNFEGLLKQIDFLKQRNRFASLPLQSLYFWVERCWTGHLLFLDVVPEYIFQFRCVFSLLSVRIYVVDALCRLFKRSVKQTLATPLRTRFGPLLLVKVVL